MAAQGIGHLSVCASDFDKSKEFYSRVLGHMGLQQAAEFTGAPHPDPEGRLVLFASPAGFMFGVFEARKEFASREHTYYAPGYHHAAFSAGSRQDVDELHEKLVAEGVHILDAPAEYPYAPGYYAVFFTDPDGMKLEYVHIPA